jgi:anti-sigma factor RsiW
MEGEKMKCSQIRKMISPFVDDELGSEQAKIFISHIQGCSACREALEETESMHQLFGPAERFEAPYGFATRVMARIEEQETRPSFWSFFTLQPVFLRAVQVAFALVVIFIGLVSGNLLVTGKTPERPTTVRESFSLDLFQTTPPDSIGGVYVTLAGAADEK